MEYKSFMAEGYSIGAHAESLYSRGYKHYGSMGQGNKQVHIFTPAKGKVDHHMLLKHDGADPVRHSGAPDLKAIKTMTEAVDVQAIQKERATKAQRKDKNIQTHNVKEDLPKNAKAGDYVDDFVHSKNKMFSGDSKKQRIKRALGAYYGQKNEDKTGLTVAVPVEVGGKRYSAVNDQVYVHSAVTKHFHGWNPTSTKVRRKLKQGTPLHDKIHAALTDHVKKRDADLEQWYKDNPHAQRHTIGEDLQELSKKTLGSYVKKAHADATDASYEAGEAANDERSNSSYYYNRANRKVQKRAKGINRAADKLAKSEDLAEGWFTRSHPRIGNRSGSTHRVTVQHTKTGHKSTFDVTAPTNEYAVKHVINHLKTHPSVLKVTQIKHLYEEKEEMADDLQELRKKTLKSYIKKAEKSMDDTYKNEKSPKKWDQVTWKRAVGITRAEKRLEKNEDNITESEMAYRAGLAGKPANYPKPAQSKVDKVKAHMQKPNYDPVKHDSRLRSFYGSKTVAAAKKQLSEENISETTDPRDNLPIRYAINHPDSQVRHHAREYKKASMAYNAGHAKLASQHRMPSREQEDELINHYEVAVHHHSKYKNRLQQINPKSPFHIKKEDLQELSKGTLQSYLARAKGDRNKADLKKSVASLEWDKEFDKGSKNRTGVTNRATPKMMKHMDTMVDQSARIDKRTKGIAAARARLTKEDLDEGLVSKITNAAKNLNKKLKPASVRFAQSREKASFGNSPKMVAGKVTDLSARGNALRKIERIEWAKQNPKKKPKDIVPMGKLPAKVWDEENSVTEGFTPMFPMGAFHGPLPHMTDHVLTHADKMANWHAGGALIAGAGAAAAAYGVKKLRDHLRDRAAKKKEAAAGAKYAAKQDQERKDVAGRQAGREAVRKEKAALAASRGQKRYKPTPKVEELEIHPGQKVLIKEKPKKGPDGKLMKSKAAQRVEDCIKMSGKKQKIDTEPSYNPLTTAGGGGGTPNA